jgi:hypothetical protein
MDCDGGFDAQYGKVETSSSVPPPLAGHECIRHFGECLEFCQHVDDFDLSELDYDDDEMDDEEYSVALQASGGFSNNAALPGLLRLSLSSPSSAAPQFIIPENLTPQEAKRFSEMSQITMELQADKEEDDFLAGRKDESHSTPQESISMLTQISQQASKRTNSIRRSIQLWQERRQIYREDYPRTVAVIAQASWYLGTFYVTHVWSTSIRILLVIGVDDRSVRARFVITLIHSWFDPFQGFLNYSVYQNGPAICSFARPCPKLDESAPLCAQCGLVFKNKTN